MIKKIHNKKNISLSELIIVILFFALSSVILTQIFVKAKNIGDLSEAITIGTVTAQNLTERVKDNPTDIDSALSFEDGWIKEKNGVYTNKYNKNMISDKNLYIYEAKITVLPKKYNSGTLYNIEILINRIFDNKNIIVLNTSEFIPVEKEGVLR